MTVQFENIYLLLADADTEKLWCNTNTHTHSFSNNYMLFWRCNSKNGNCTLDRWLNIILKQIVAAHTYNSVKLKFSLSKWACYTEDRYCHPNIAYFNGKKIMNGIHADLIKSQPSTISFIFSDCFENWHAYIAWKLRNWMIISIALFN